MAPTPTDSEEQQLASTEAQQISEDVQTPTSKEQQLILTEIQQPTRTEDQPSTSTEVQQVAEDEQAPASKDQHQDPPNTASDHYSDSDSDFEECELTTSASFSNLSNIPRTKSLILSDHSTVLQAMPNNSAEVVEVVADQSWLLTKLSFQLLWALRTSYKWMFMTVRLGTFVVLLLPAFLSLVYRWIRDPDIHKNIVYGRKRRNLLDVYTVPKTNTNKTENLDKESKPTNLRPVVIFLSGGAWIIGYKGWGAVLGKVLSTFGIVVVTPDYRNFPQGLLPDMVDDASNAIQWVLENIHHFGGDPENITLVGQSAGAHIAMCTLLEKIQQTNKPKSCETEQSLLWQLHQIKNVVGISGPYNIETSIEIFHKHGFDRSVVERIMNHQIGYYSPALRLQEYQSQQLLADFPPVYSLHNSIFSIQRQN